MSSTLVEQDLLEHVEGARVIGWSSGKKRNHCHDVMTVFIEICSYIVRQDDLL